MNFRLPKIVFNDPRFDRGRDQGRDRDRLKTGILYNEDEEHTDELVTDGDGYSEDADDARATYVMFAGQRRYGYPLDQYTVITGKEDTVALTTDIRRMHHHTVEMHMVVEHRVMTDRSVAVTAKGASTADVPVVASVLARSQKIVNESSRTLKHGANLSASRQLSERSISRR